MSGHRYILTIRDREFVQYSTKSQFVVLQVFHITMYVFMGLNYNEFSFVIATIMLNS